MTILNRVIRQLPSMLLAMAATVCVSQVSAGPQAASNPHTIGGQVVNSVTSEPIARARVQAGSHAALTDHEGRFEFDDASEDPTWAFVSKPGYFAEDNEALAQGQSVTLRLIPEAIIFGTIIDQNGQPIQDLRIQLKMLQAHNGFRSWQTVQSTTTSVEGKFRFAELQAGQYSLAAGFRIEGLPDAASSVAFMPVTFPPPTGDGIHGALTLTAGDQVEANASPAVEKLYPVSGVVNGMVGQGGGFAVETEDGEPVDIPVRIYPGGVFRLRLPSGSYRINLRSALDREHQLVGTREVSVGVAPLEGISITLEPPANLPIEVEYQAVTSATQNAASATPPYLNASLQNDDPQGPPVVFPAQPLKLPGRAQVLEPGGPMVFRDVEPGRYAMQARPQPPWYVASASCGSLDLTRDPLVIAAGVAACTVRMVFRDDSASLKWSATVGEAGNESSQVFVVAIPLDNLTQSVTSASTFSNHKLSSDSPAEGSFEGLAPGRYLVMALPHQQELPYRDREALQRYLSLGQEVTLTRGGKSEVQLKMVAGEL